MRSECEEKQKFLKALNKTSNRRPRRSESKLDAFESGSTRGNKNVFRKPNKIKRVLNQSVSCYSASPIDLVDEAIGAVKIKTEDSAVPASSSNQISAAEASLAVTALKLSAGPSLSRRRTVSIKVEEDEVDV
jgi:hypothetical protein